jgi:hypothetical protein
VYIKNSISKKVIEIPTEMKVIWIGVKSKASPGIKVCIGFTYKAPQNSRWYNPNFTKELEGDINNLRDSYPNSEFLIMGDWNSRIETKQEDLPHLFDKQINGIIAVITGMEVGNVRIQCVMQKEES